MSRQVIITCDLCEQQVPVAAGSWRNLDFCGTCLETPRPPGEVLELIRRMDGADGMYVSAEDIIPERTRARRPAPGTIAAARRADSHHRARAPAYRARPEAC